MLDNKNSFILASVVVPARNGMLASLGYDLNKLGERALGIVIAEGSSRVLVHFPELRITLWLDNSELADVNTEASRGKEAYCALLPTKDVGQYPVVWLLQYLMKRLSLVEVLEIEHGTLEKIWEETEPLNENEKGFSQSKALRVGLGIEGLSPEKIKEITNELSSRLIALRLHPSGMHKFEARFYLFCLR